MPPDASTSAPEPAKESLLHRAGARVWRAVSGRTPGGAFGAPGGEPRWTPSTKEGVGTAAHTSCQLWFTLAHGIVNEVFYPHVDRPNTRDLQYLITDGESFIHEERRDLDHAIDYPEKRALLYRLTNSDPAGRYRLVKEIACDPHHSVLLIHTRLEIFDEALRGKLRVFALLAPHLNRAGRHNSAAFCNMGGRALFHVWRHDALDDPTNEDLHMAFGAQPNFLRRSCGYVGKSDGWQDLRDFTMDWEFPAAEDGNIALTGECDLTRGGEWTLALGFGRSTQSAGAKLLQALATPFAKHRATFVQAWQEATPEPDFAEHTGDGGSLFRLSRCLLYAHEDKVFCGAIVASLSIPWGEKKGDGEIGGYHLVWPRDLVQSATGLLACGHADTPRRALIWLAALQEDDGALPQNSWIDGTPFQGSLQLDEVAAPVLLAWRLREAGGLADFDPWTLVSRAARYLILHGPVTRQERWEELSGYSPATLAACIAALVCAAEFARERGLADDADFALAYADWLSAHLEEWCATTRGELLPERPRHFLRLTPADPDAAPALAEPDTATLTLPNAGGSVPARNVVSPDFLQLVRLGLRAADDPLIVASLAVVDAVLKHDFPQGPCWRRYNGDRYGQQADGTAWEGGDGVGGGWPLLTGERGHYELAAGRDPRPFIEAMERFSNAGGMLPEQVWCGEDLPGVKRGHPTGSAMPLCWAHAEYMTLVRSAADGAPFDCIAPAHARYVAQPRPACTHEMWSCTHPLASIPAGRTLRLITSGPAVIHWESDDGSAGDAPAHETAFGCWFADLPTRELHAGATVQFRLLCDEKHSGDQHRVAIGTARHSS